MTRQKVSIQQVAAGYEPAEIDLWADTGGAVFLTVDITQPVQDRIDEIQEQIANLGPEDSAVGALGDMFDAVLVPKTAEQKIADPLWDGPKTRAPKVTPSASALIVAKYRAGDVGLDTIRRTFEAIMEATRPN